MDETAFEINLLAGTVKKVRFGMITQSNPWINSGWIQAIVICQITVAGGGVLKIQWGSKRLLSPLTLSLLVWGFADDLWRVFIRRGVYFLSSCWLREKQILQAFEEWNSKSSLGKPRYSHVDVTLSKEGTVQITNYGQSTSSILHFSSDIFKDLFVARELFKNSLIATIQDRKSVV